VLQSAISIQQFDSVHFNQLSGKEIIAFLDSNQLKMIHVNGNAETIYIIRWTIKIQRLSG
jgi:hypothetical protein